MDGNRWSEAKRIVADALEVEPAERDQVISRACRGDDELGRVVRSLLDAHDAAGDFLQPPSSGTYASWSPSDGAEPTSRSGGFIGPYQLVEPLGEGGMGEVWLARQSEPVRRAVALKIVKVGMDTRRVRDRFATECQALALMDHPNIATVLDAGSTATGSPYLVMELIDGVPLTRYADANRLTVPERLRLFLGACSAIEHAHQKGVIHRDIKPANLLVTLGDGIPVVKVIDFGIAKAYGQPLTGARDRTRTGQLLGTPDYISPEQAVGEVNVDTRSDIYSLGVVLYELLTGALPYEGAVMDRGIFSPAVLDREPQRPSTHFSRSDTQHTIAMARATSIRRLRRDLAGDLDWIVLKAMAKDRERRYATASDLARDLSAHLSNDPVQARPPSAVYRLRKAVRRNRAAAAGLAAALVACMVGTVASSTGFARARHEARVATSRELAAASINMAHDPALSLLLAMEAAETSPTAQAQNALHRALDARIPGVIRGVPGTIYELGWLGPGGSRDPSRRGGGVAVVAATPRTTTSADGYDRRESTGRVVTISDGGPGDRTLDGLFDPASLTMWRAATDETQFTQLTQITGLAAVSPDGRWRASVRFDGSQLIRDREGRAALLGAGPPLIDVAFSPVGHLLAAARVDGTVELWDTESWRRGVTVDSKRTERLRHLEFSPDGRLLVAGDRIWHTESGAVAMSFGDGVNDVAFSRDGSRVATASLDGSATVWDVDGGHQIFELVGNREPVTQVALSPDNRSLAAARVDGTVEIRDVERRIASGPSGGPGVIGTGDPRIAFGPESRRIALSTSTATTVWDVATGARLARRVEDVTRTGFDPDVEYLPNGHVRISKSGAVTVWDPATEVVEPIMEWADHGVVDVALTPDGSRLATGRRDGGVALRDAEGSTVLLEVPLPGWCSFLPCSVVGKDAVRDVAISTDGELLVAVGGRFAAAWDVRTGRRRLMVDGRRSDSFVAVARSPSGRFLATAGDSARVWDLQDGERLPSVGTHVRRVEFSPTGDGLVAIGSDGAARLWDVATGELLLSLAEPSWDARVAVEDVAFSPDGRRVATVSADATVRIYPHGVDALLAAARERQTRELTDAECRRFLHVDGCASSAFLRASSPNPERRSIISGAVAEVLGTILGGPLRGGRR